MDPLVVQIWVRAERNGQPKRLVTHALQWLFPAVFHLSSIPSLPSLSFFLTRAKFIRYHLRVVGMKITVFWGTLTESIQLSLGLQWCQVMILSDSSYRVHKIGSGSKAPISLGLMTVTSSNPTSWFYYIPRIYIPRTHWQKAPLTFCLSASQYQKVEFMDHMETQMPIFFWEVSLLFPQKCTWTN